ncbi:hypothetical protein [Spiroplasma chrysopicola]|uniref:Transmembrane protein n=1 Tax=Spiroplasma chrysopicola DF-1 TaxID=1276227 RepID=R4UJM6_9MOLU|nr:hypothetical protein [Spiroplasma chrysopicola]AGM25511.1 hypothetical protein SCHRY_v1c09390 [Spiroplasma chrysopicola DF-1]
MDIYEIANKSVNTNIWICLGMLFLMYTGFFFIDFYLIYINKKLKTGVKVDKYLWKLQLWKERKEIYIRKIVINTAFYVSFSFIIIVFEKVLIINKSILISYLWFRIFFIEALIPSFSSIYVVTFLTYISFKIFKHKAISSKEKLIW